MKNSKPDMEIHGRQRWTVIPTLPNLDHFEALLNLGLTSSHMSTRMMCNTAVSYEVLLWACHVPIYSLKWLMCVPRESLESHCTHTGGMGGVAGGGRQCLTLIGQDSGQLWLVRNRCCHEKISWAGGGGKRSPDCWAINCQTTDSSW
jgi:hypothetical protein